jgi:hypothetical protein
LQVDDATARIAGIIWLVSALLWLATTTLFFLRKGYFWKVALVNVVISQLLIIFYWPYAEFGTIMNVLVLGVVIVNIGRSNFDTSVDREWCQLVASAAKKNIGGSNNSTLPPVVKKWLQVSKSTNMVPSRVILTQEGVMRTNPKADWMPFSATQYYTIDPPAFLWNSQMKAGSMITIAARDKFENGKGNMLIKPLFIYTLANSSGMEIDQGALLRYMAEIIWFPEAATMGYFRWEAIDSTNAALSMTCNGTTAKGIFTFDQDGLVKKFCAERFGDFNGHPGTHRYRKELWEAKVIEHSLVNGHLIGSKCEVTWKLKEGDFTWLKLEVKSIRYS